MFKYIRKLTGFSLFEIMLVLLVASMIAVAGIKYAQHEREVAVDQIYGSNLFSFGHAVKQYISDAKLSSANQFLPGPAPTNQNGCYTGCTQPLIISTDSANNKVITATGVDWLKKVNTGPTSTGGSYLDDNFSFTNNMAPLIIAVPDPSTGVATASTGNAAIKTIITITPTGPQIQITVGALYKPVSGTDPVTHQPLPPAPMPSLTQEAIQHANTMYDSYKGAAAIQYAFPYVSTTGALTPNAQVTGQTNAAATIDYLRTDGSNKMIGPIGFDPATSGSNKLIQEVQNLEFAANADNTSKGIMQNLNTLFIGPNNNSGDSPKIVFQDANSSTSPNSSFGGGIIRGVSDIEFAPYSGQSSASKPDPSISGLKNIAFDPQGLTYHPSVPGSWSPSSQCSNPGYQIRHPNCRHTPGTPAYFSTTGNKSSIAGLDLITFANNAVLMGVRLANTTQNGPDGSGSASSVGLHIKATTGSSGSHTGSTDLSDGSGALYPSNSICYLTAVGFHDTASSPSVDRRCFVDDQGSNGQWRLVWNDAMTCKAACYVFGR